MPLLPPPLLGTLLIALGLAAVSPAAADEYRLSAQDRIRVKAFEWRPSRDEVFEWEAINDEYGVGPGGAVMLPLAGDVRAAGATTTELAGAISDQLKRNLSLRSQPDVSVEIVQYRPFYITGQVEKPGEYPYRPGLTVLQAVAIAGGLARTKDPGLLRMEREMISTEGDLRLLFVERLALTVRRARLETELTEAGEFVPPPALARYASDEAYQAATRQEKLIFKARREAYDTQTAALKQLRAHLDREIDSLKEQIVLEDRQTSLIKRELQSLTALVDRGLAVTSRQLAMERSVAQSESDKIKLSVSLMKGFQEISKTEIGVLELRNKRTTDVTAELREIQGKIDAAAAKEATARRLLEESEASAPVLMRRGRAQPVPRYAITRPVASGSENVPVADSGAVAPGETLSVELLPPEDLPSRREAALMPPGAGTPVPTAASR